MSKTPKRAVAVTLDGWGAAAGSFASCPKCDASARVRHVEPATGGGQLEHHHRCRRCRYEWRQEPVSWRLCGHMSCDAHGFDATGLGGHLEMVTSAMQASIAEMTYAQSVFRDIGIKPPKGEEQQTVQVVRALYHALGGDMAAVAKWLHAKNTAFAFSAPATLFGEVRGLEAITSYLAARHIEVGHSRQ